MKLDCVVNVLLFISTACLNHTSGMLYKRNNEQKQKNPLALYF
nr:MAG TPA: conotoxin [Siphoviridae sp. ctRJB2]